MTTTLSWIPSATKPPCRVGNTECANKHKLHGTCRTSCKSYAQYEQLRMQRSAIINERKTKYYETQQVICDSIRRMKARV